MGWSGLHDGCPLHGHATDQGKAQRADIGCLCAWLIKGPPREPVSTYDPKARAAYQVRGLGQLIGEAMNKDGTAVGEAINRCEAEFEKELRAAVEAERKAWLEAVKLEREQPFGRWLPDTEERVALSEWATGIVEAEREACAVIVDPGGITREASLRAAIAARIRVRGESDGK